MGDGHLDLEAMDVEVDLEEIEMTEEAVIEGVVEEVHATTATNRGIWPEIALKVTAVMVVEEVEAEVGHATIATRKDTWQENVLKEIVEIEKWPEDEMAQ